jgi:hypothetical protein
MSMLLFMVLSLSGNVFAWESDKLITSIVENKLQSDNQLLGCKIDVNASDGEVTLKGTVNSFADITRATNLVRSVDGVKEVDSRLKRAEPFSSCTYHGSQHIPGCPVGASWSSCTPDKYK